MTPTRVLLTGVGSPASQNVLRSLRAVEIPYYIVGADANRYHLEWGDLDAAYEAPLTASDEYLPFLRDVIERERIEFIHGQPDWEVLWLAEHRGHFDEGIAMLLPRHDVIRLCQDKFDSAVAWESAGLRDDRALSLGTRGDVPHYVRFMGGRFGYPFWLRACHGAGARGSCKVENWEQGIAWLNYWRATGVEWTFMAQEYLPGREFAFQSVWKDGELITSAARERLEFVFPQHAPSGVTSSPVVARTAHNDAVNEVAYRAILAVDPKPNGVYGVDMKEDGDGVPRPTEINAGRFFTTSHFFSVAGMNMPHVYVQLGLGATHISSVPMDVLPKYNAVPKGLYWIRHIDCEARLVKASGLRCVRLRKEVAA